MNLKYQTERAIAPVLCENSNLSSVLRETAAAEQ